jgi:hypothetical protein
MKLRFAIRDLLWLTAIVALVAGWLTDRSRPVPQYLIQIEEVKTDYASSKSDEIVKTECLRAAKLLCHLGKPATTETTVGNVTFTVKALVREHADGVLATELSYYTSIENGDTIPDEYGIRKPYRATSGGETTLHVRLNERQELGGGDTTTSTSRYKQVYVLTATKHDPHTD